MIYLGNYSYGKRHDSAQQGATTHRSLTTCRMNRGEARSPESAAPTSYAWARAVEAKAREILASLVERPAGVVTKP